MSFKWVYPLWYVSISGLALFIVSFFDDVMVSIYTVIGYIILCFVLTSFRLLYVLDKVSKLAKEKIPEIYQEHMGSSSFGHVRLVLPSIVVDERLPQVDDSHLLRYWYELRYLYLGIVIGFVTSAALMILSTM